MVPAVGSQHSRLISPRSPKRRSGREFQAVPEGQWQAGRSLGLPELVLLGLVILPQGIRLAIPLVTSKVISSTKDTALASVVAVPELLNQMSTEQGNYANPSPLMLGALMYLVMFVPLVVLSRRIEQRQLRRAW